MSSQEIVQQFVLLWSVIDPIGTVPVFMAVAAGLSVAAQKQLALKAVFVAGLVLIFFVLAGELLLRAMSIPLSAFQVAGGVVLFVFAMTMIFGESKPESELALAKRNADAAIYPLAIPSIASPGAIMASVLLTDSYRYSPVDQMITAAILVSILLITLGLLLVAHRLQRLLGTSGASLVSRVMGLLLASIAASNVMAGIADYYGLQNSASSLI